MSRFECICCGAPLDVTSIKNTVVCKSCGLEQTVPVTDLKTENLFRKAEQQRRFQQYDEAMETYSNILKLKPDSAEAYWQMCLCRYGVDFVIDPPTGKAMPTCNRMRQELITADIDFKQACEQATIFVRDYYQKTADYIARIQQNYNLLKKTVKPYDIFICYKESNEDGSRTRDSIHAEKIYEELTNEGYRVFFSRRTLQEMSGQQYEGHIFMALSHAKVMILLSSKMEYVETPWMKNEWTRYLYQMSQDASKKLFLLYRNLNPEELPAPLSKLQNLDMRRWNFVDTLKENLKEIFALKESMQEEEEQENDEEYQVLYEKAKSVMSAKKYEEASACYEKLLDYIPESAEYYWNLYIAKQNGKAKCKDIKSIPFELKMAIRFGNEEQCTEYLKKAEISGGTGLISSKKELETEIQVLADAEARKKREEEEYRKAREEAQEKERKRKERIQQRDRELKEASRKIRSIYENQINARSGLSEACKELERKDKSYYSFKMWPHLLFLIALITHGVLHRLTFEGDGLSAIAVFVGMPVLVTALWLFLLSAECMDVSGVLALGFIPVLVHIVMAFGGFVAWDGGILKNSFYYFVYIQVFLYLIVVMRHAADCDRIKQQLTALEKMKKNLQNSVELMQNMWKEEFERIQARYTDLPKKDFRELEELKVQNMFSGVFTGIFSSAKKYGIMLLVKKVLIIICCAVICAVMTV